MDEKSGSNIARLHTVIEGHVQGVGFRYFVLNKAQQLNLTGWVRNTLEGNVEVLAEGEQDQLIELLEALHKGPRSAFVTNLKEQWETPLGEFTKFGVGSTS
jgi:acylphosphatase